MAYGKKTHMLNERRKLYNSLKSIFLHIDNQEKLLLSKFNLTVPRFYVLMHIHNTPGINYIDLSELMLCTKGNTTRVVQSMYKDGLVARSENKEDRRSYHLHLTNKGETAYKEVFTAYLDHINNLMSKINEDQLQTYTDFSNNIKHTLTS
jgi:DNA-binding MarR family transcriptional regulator